MWCARQSRAALVRSVAPPSAQWIRWWASVQVGGLLQPGKVQPRSRSHRCLTWAAVKSRTACRGRGPRPRFRRRGRRARPSRAWGRCLGRSRDRGSDRSRSDSRPAASPRSCRRSSPLRQSRVEKAAGLGALILTACLLLEAADQRHRLQQLDCGVSLGQRARGGRPSRLRRLNRFFGRPRSTSLRDDRARQADRRG